MIKNFKDYYGDKLAASVGDIGHLNEFDYKCMAIGEPFVKALQGNAARQNLICPPSLVKLCLEEITVTKIVTCTDIQRCKTKTSEGLPFSMTITDSIPHYE